MSILGCLRDYSCAFPALQSLLLFMDLKMMITQTFMRTGTTGAVDFDPYRQCSAYSACIDGLGREQLF